MITLMLIMLCAIAVSLNGAANALEEPSVSVDEQAFYRLPSPEVNILLPFYILSYSPERNTFYGYDETENAMYEVKAEPGAVPQWLFDLPFEYRFGYGVELSQDESTLFVLDLYEDDQSVTHNRIIAYDFATQQLSTVVNTPTGELHAGYLPSVNSLYTLPYPLIAAVDGSYLWLWDLSTGEQIDRLEIPYGGFTMLDTQNMRYWYASTSDDNLDLQAYALSETGISSVGDVQQITGATMHNQFADWLFAGNYLYLSMDSLFQINLETFETTEVMKEIAESNMAVSTDGQYLFFDTEAQTVIYPVDDIGSPIQTVGLENANGEIYPMANGGVAFLSNSSQVLLFRPKAADIFAPLIFNHYCGVFITDDFSNTQSGWLSRNDVDFRYGYRNERYIIELDKSSFIASVITPHPWENSEMVQIDGRIAQGTGAWGFAWGSSFDDYEILAVNPDDGSILRFRVTAENGVDLLYQSDVPQLFSDPTGFNTLRFERNGVSNSILLNNEPIDGADPFKGFFGLSMLSFSDGTTAEFDNYYFSGENCPKPDRAPNFPREAVSQPAPLMPNDGLDDPISAEIYR